MMLLQRYVDISIWSKSNSSYIPQDLIELFGEYGPIKRASIAQQDGVSKGFGFVKLYVLGVSVMLFAN